MQITDCKRFSYLEILSNLLDIWSTFYPLSIWAKQCKRSLIYSESRGPPPEHIKDEHGAKNLQIMRQVTTCTEAEREYASSLTRNCVSILNESFM